MNNLLIIFLFLLFSCSKNETTTTPPAVVYSEFCTSDARFTDVEFFNENQIDSEKDILYATAENWFGIMQDLELDIYQPNQNIDPMEKRPLVVLIHGGGFIGGDKLFLEDLCIEFSKRGFVCASIEYRLGRFELPESTQKAIYRAQQDANAALRFLANKAEEYRIETEHVFVGGQSAGAVTALYVNYASEEEWGFINSTLESELGALHQNGNNYSDNVTILGLFNNWGSVPNLIFSAEEMIPTIAFHGALDIVVPIDNYDQLGFSLLGSRSIHNAMESAGGCSDLTVEPQGGHGIYTDTEGIKFRASRASCFFKSVMCDQCQTVSFEGQEPPICFFDNN